MNASTAREHSRTVILVPVAHCIESRLAEARTAFVAHAVMDRIEVSPRTSFGHTLHWFAGGAFQPVSIELHGQVYVIWQATLGTILQARLADLKTLAGRNAFVTAVDAAVTDLSVWVGDDPNFSVIQHESLHQIVEVLMLLREVV